MLTPEEIEQKNKRIYEEEYSLSQVSIDKTLNTADYFHKMTQTRLGLIRKYGNCKHVLDIGCGTGDYLIETSKVIREGVGIDFGKPAINEAISKKKNMSIDNIEFVNCNAKQIPYKIKTFDLIYSFSTLYYIPEVEKVIYEVARLLKPNSIAILEFGNFWSLNTIVCKAYPELAISCHIKINEIKKILNKIGVIVEWRAFQILPLWGSRPMWLKPLLHPLWKKILQKEINAKMLDEWICKLPIFKKFAFRHLFIIKKN
ncbi:MAG: class I SAM-dependent methyltransferase [Candidatus Hodarchaeota archaeon]